MSQETNIAVTPQGLTVSTAQTDTNGDGVPDVLQQVLDNPDFKNDWTNRRRLIFYVMAVLGLTTVAIVGCMCWLLLSRTGGDLEHVLDSTDSYLYAASFVAVSIIGSYVFGSHFGSASLRNSVVEIVKNVRGSGRR